MDIEKIISTTAFTKVIVGIGLVCAGLFLFEGGVYVGSHKAALSARIGQAYYTRAMGGPDAHGPFGDALPDAHGAAGKILSVNLPAFLVEDNDQEEKVILVSDTTTIRLSKDATTSAAITPGEFAIIIGDPNDKGEVEAKFIRLLPPPPSPAQ